ncbi:MAG: RDD family protein, partial [Flexibacteraceae bacterium]
MSETLPPVKNIYGNFWYRLVAVIIDAIVLGIVSFLITLPIKSSFGDDFIQLQLVSGAISFLLYLIYGSVMESSGWQGSIGKKVLNLKVTNLEGEALSFSEALVRNLVKYWANMITVIVPFVSDIKPAMPNPADPMSAFTGPYMTMVGLLSLLSIIGYVIAA